MPWPWNWRLSNANPPPPSPEARDVCKEASCAIQTCLKKNDFRADACGDAVDALRACCKERKARDSVHCSEAWKKGR
jgi:hypothetical protein